MFEKFGFFNKEAKDESKEAHVNTGRAAEGITDNLAEAQESREETDGEKRFRHLVKEIKMIMEEENIRPEEAMNDEYKYAEKLQEKDVITMKDMGYSGMPETIRQAIKKAATERIAEAEEFRKTGIRKTA